MFKITLCIWVDRADKTLLKYMINSQILKNNKTTQIKTKCILFCPQQAKYLQRLYFNQNRIMCLDIAHWLLN